MGANESAILSDGMMKWWMMCYEKPDKSILIDRDSDFIWDNSSVRKGLVRCKIKPPSSIKKEKETKGREMNYAFSLHKFLLGPRFVKKKIPRLSFYLDFNRFVFVIKCCGHGIYV